MTEQEIEAFKRITERTLAELKNEGLISNWKLEINSDGAGICYYTPGFPILKCNFLLSPNEDKTA